MDVDEHARRKPRQEIEDNAVDVGARHCEVARIHKQHVACRERGEEVRRRLAEQARQVPDAAQCDGGAGRRIDAGDRRAETAVGDRAREEARRVPRPDLDDPPRLVGAQDGVGGGGVEPREPVLVEARRTVAGRDRVELARRRADVVEHRPEPGLRRLKQRPQGRVAYRRDRAGMAVGDEEAAPREPEDRREAEAEPARLASHDQTGGPGVPGGGGVVAGPIRSRQEWARRARSNSSTTTSAIMKGMRR